MDLGIIQVLAAGLVTFGIVYVTIPVLIKVAYLKDLYDKPDNDRKLHSSYIPTLGGIAIFLAFFVGFSTTGVASSFTGFPYLAAALVLLFFTGLKDDIVSLSPVKKLIVQFICAGLLIFGSNIYIESFHGVLGINDLPYWGSVVITMFTMIVVVNAYNLIDGVDGLAGGIGTIASLFFGLGFLIAGIPDMAAMSFILAVALTGFLLYNFKPASIFMGDTGSLIVGFLLSIFAIKFIGLNEVAAYTDIFGYSSPVIPVAILAVPLYDTLRVFYRRAKKKTSPFLPGKDHIHHELLRMGFGHSGTSLVLYFSSIILSSLALALSSMNVHLILAIVLVSTVVLFPTNGKKRRILKSLGFDVENRLKMGQGILHTYQGEKTRSEDAKPRSKEKKVKDGIPT